jgi:hypothetical protein
MLTQARIAEYNEGGPSIVPDILTPEEVQILRSVTDGFVERPRGLTGHKGLRRLRPAHHHPAPCPASSSRLRMKRTMGWTSQR